MFGLAKFPRSGLTCPDNLTRENRTMDETTKPKSAFERQWHHIPDVPIETSPLFSWPPRPLAAARWIADRWFSIGENIILAALAFAVWFYLSPSLEMARTLSADWMAFVFARNLILMILVAGGLHWFFHSEQKQDDKLKFDPRNVPMEGRSFSFGNQIRDNMFWTLASGVTTWTAYEIAMLWAMANGHIPTLGWADNPAWFIALILLTPLWISFHFYWIHRFLHWPPMYKIAHAVHHRNTNVGPWSGLSMHPIETILFFSSVLIHLVVAAHPVHILFHLFHQALTAATSHTGFEALVVKDKSRLALGTFHHQMHHRYFECNYGNLEVPWDKAFGSFHDGTDASHEAFKERRKKMIM